MQLTKFSYPILLFFTFLNIDIYSQCTATIEHFNACDKNIDNFVIGKVYTSHGDSVYSIFTDGSVQDIINISPTENTYWSWVPTSPNTTCGVVHGKVSPCFSTPQLDSIQSLKECDNDTLFFNHPSYQAKNLSLQSEKVVKIDVVLTPGTSNGFRAKDAIILDKGFELPLFSNLTISNDGCSTAQSFLDSCTMGQDLSAWFGGDDRENLEGVKGRSVGFGQSIVLENNLTLIEIGFYLDTSFQYYSNKQVYDKEIKIHMDLRNEFGKILLSDTTLLPETFNGGLVNFELSPSKQANLSQSKKYIFTSYLINAKELQVSNAVLGRSTPTQNHNLCNGISYSAGIDSSSTLSLSDWKPWSARSENFFIRIKGEEF